MDFAVKVAIRIRPLIEREDGSSLLWSVSDHTHTIKTTKENGGKSYYFDRVFDVDEESAHVYEEIAEPIVQTVMEGFNGTIFAYGQTGSGKTYTMIGEENNPGITPRSVNEVFNWIQKTPAREYLIRVSYMEIYNESIRDLLADQNENLQIRGDECKVRGLSEHAVRTPQDVMNLMATGEQKRRVGCTNMNEKSSRSHTIFRMIIESRERQKSKRESDGNEFEGAVMVSQLNLVDLAGSERVSQTGAEGERFKEGIHINKSLSVLGLVINQLSKNSESLSASSNASGIANTKHFINYRGSKLTRILQPALGGNSYTAIICAVTPAAMDETESTLRFASSAKRLKTKPTVNELLTDEALLIRQQKEIRNLKKKIEELKQKSATSATDETMVKLKLEHSRQISEVKKLILVSNQDSNDQTKKRKLRRETWCGQKHNAASINLKVPTLVPTITNSALLDISSLNESSFASSSKKLCTQEEHEKRKLQNKLEELEEEVKTLNEQATADKELIEAKTKTISKLEECVDMMKENWDAESKAEDQNEKLKLENHKLRSEIVEMQNRSISATPTRTSAMMQDMHVQLRESLTEKRILQEKYDEVCQKQEELTHRLFNQKNDISETAKCSQKSSDETMHNTSSVPDGERTLALIDAISYSEQLIKDKEETDRIIASLNEEIERLKTQNRQLEKDFKNIMEQDEFNKLESQSINEFALKTALDKLAASEDEIVLLRASLVNVQEDRQNLSEESLKHETMQKASKGKEKSQNIKMTLLEQELLQMSCKHEALQTEYDAIKTMLEELKDKHADLQTTHSFIDQYEQKLCELKDDSSFSANKEENMIQQSSEDADVIKSLKDEIEALKAVHASMDDNKDDGIGFAAELDQELIESLKEKVKNLQQDLADKEDEITRLEEDLSKLKSDFDMKQENQDSVDNQNCEIVNARIKELQNLLDEKNNSTEEMKSDFVLKEEEYKNSIFEFEKERSFDDKLRELTAYDGRLKDKEDVILILKNEKREAEGNLASNISQYEKVVLELRMELSTLQDKINADAKKMQTISDNFENAKAHIAKLQSQKQETEEQLTQALSGFNQAQEQISEFEKVNKDADTGTSKISKDLIKSQIEIEFFKNQNNDYEKTLSDKKRELIDLQESCDKLHKEITESKEVISIKELKCNELKAALTRKDTLCSDLQIDLEAKQKQISELGNDVEIYKEKAEKAKMELDDLFARIAEKAGDMEAVAQNREALENEADSLKEEVELLQAKLTRSEEEKTRLQEVNAQHKTQISTLEERIFDAKSIEISHDELENTKLSYEDKLKLAKQDNNELSASYDVLMKDLETAVKAKEEAVDLSETSLENLKKERKFFENEIGDLNIKHSDMKHKFQALRRKVEDKEVEIMDLKKRLKEAEEDFGTSSSVDSLNQEILKKNRQISALQQEIKQMEESASNSEHQNHKLAHKYSKEIVELRDDEEKLRLDLEKKQEELILLENKFEAYKLSAESKANKLVEESERFGAKEEYMKQKILDSENELIRIKSRYSQQYNVYKTKYDQIVEEGQSWRQKYEERQSKNASTEDMQKTYTKKLYDLQQMLEKKDHEINLLNAKIEQLNKTKQDAASSESSSDNVGTSHSHNVELFENKSLQDMEILLDIERLPTVLERTEKMLSFHKQRLFDTLDQYEEVKEGVLHYHQILNKDIQADKLRIKKLCTTNSSTTVQQAAGDWNKACELKKLLNKLEFQQIQEATQYNGHHRMKFKLTCRDLFEEFQPLMDLFHEHESSLRESIVQKKIPEWLEGLQYDDMFIDKMRKFSLLYIKIASEVKNLIGPVNKRKSVLEKIKQETSLERDNFNKMEFPIVPKTEDAGKKMLVEKRQLMRELITQQEVDLRTKLVNIDVPWTGAQRLKYLEMFKEREKPFMSIKDGYDVHKKDILELTLQANNTTADLQTKLQQSLQQVNELKTELSNSESMNFRLKQEIRRQNSDNEEDTVCKLKPTRQKSAVEDLMFSQKVEQERRENAQRTMFLEKELAKYKDIEIKRRAESTTLLEENKRLRDYIKTLKPPSESDTGGATGGAMQDAMNKQQTGGEDEESKCKTQ